MFGTLFFTRVGPATTLHAARCKRAAVWSMCCQGPLIDKWPATVIVPVHSIHNLDLDVLLHIRHNGRQEEVRD